MAKLDDTDDVGKILETARAAVVDLIRKQIEAMIDTTKWRKCEATEQRNRLLLGRVSENWAKIRKAVRDGR